MCLLSIEKGQAKPFEADPLTRELLDTNKCYLLDCGLEVFVWMGRNTSLDERKTASGAAEVMALFSILYWFCARSKCLTNFVLSLVLLNRS